MSLEYRKNSLTLKILKRHYSSSLSRWLAENVEKDNYITSQYETGNIDYDLRIFRTLPNYVNITFKYEEDMLLFKLTWGHTLKHE